MKYVCWYVEEEVEEFVWPWGPMNSLAKRFAWGSRGRRKLCMVSCHSYHICGI